MTNEIWLQGTEHGWPHSVRVSQRRPRSTGPVRFRLSDWLPAAIRARGGEATRDDERLYRDLQAARDARESGR